MSTVTAPAPARTTIVTPPTARLSFGRVLRSEWIKLSTLRSTWWSIAIVAVLSIAMSLLIASSSRGFGEGFDTILVVIMPIQFTMLLAGIMGVIAVTGEYSTGMIRSTLTAEPHRGIVLAAKAVVVGVLMGVSSLIIFVLSAIATAPIVTTPIAWDDPARSILPILYGSLCMAVFALIGLAWGFVLRNGPGAIAATVGVLFVLPIVQTMFPSNDPGWQWVHDLGQYLPMSLAQVLTTPAATSLSDGAALLALAGWIVVGLGAGWAVLRTRDA